MPNIISEIRKSYENKIAALQREIDQLKTKMENVISTIQEDIGDQGDVAPPLKAITTEPRIIKKTQTLFGGEPNTRNRLIQSIDRMNLNGFGTDELLSDVNADGNTKQVNKNRALKIFKDIINEGIVEIIAPHSGKRGGVYKKVVKSPNETSSAV